jgi:hypothetical protein
MDSTEKLIKKEEQQIFERVVRHLYRQDRQSSDNAGRIVLIHIVLILLTMLFTGLLIDAFFLEEMTNTIEEEQRKFMKFTDEIRSKV